ncbi:MAG: TlpA family protein disulfide reductase [Acidobacteriia bacterium]|nr:TlpA family protein disulfide reductase [Terriglobia bacterium]
MISKRTPVCPTSDSRHAPRLASSLRAGTITDTTGPLDTGFAVVIGRIRYYSCVRPAFAFLGLVTLLLAGCYSGSRPPRIGTTPPDFSVQDSDRRITLNELHGKVVVLNFWATWCPPCVEEMPSLVQMQQRLKDKGITVLAVSVDVDEDAYHKFLKDYKVNLLTVRDPSHKSSDLYGTFKYPETYIIDRNGTLRRKFIGPVDWTTPEILEYLTKL